MVSGESVGRVVLSFTIRFMYSRTAIGVVIVETHNNAVLGFLPCVFSMRLVTSRNSEVAYHY